MSGIVGYGAYVPKYRIKVSEIASVWKKSGQEITSRLKVLEKSVPAYDEDTITIGIEAAKKSLAMSKIKPEEIGSVYVGSESHPYAVKSSSSIIARYLDIGNNYLAADLEFACKAATAGMQITLGLLNSKQINYGLVIGSDTAQSKPQDILEYTAASAGCAFILGNKQTDSIANVLMFSSFTSETPDFWRRDGQKFPSHFGRFTAEPAYFNHVLSESKKLLKESKLKPEDFSYCVFHMPNGKFPRTVAEKLGFTSAQIEPSLIVEKIGNSYSASSLLGLCAVLDIAKPEQKIFFVSYGSGAGSDGFILETTSHITAKQQNTIPLLKQLEDKLYVSYATYLKNTHTL